MNSIVDILFLAEKTCFNLVKVTCGVLQGSILGTLLFISYINDIANVSNIFKINLFADDTRLFHTHENFESLIKETNQ